METYSQKNWKQLSFNLHPTEIKIYFKKSHVSVILIPKLRNQECNVYDQTLKKDWQLGLIVIRMDNMD